LLSARKLLAQIGAAIEYAPKLLIVNEKNISLCNRTREFASPLGNRGSGVVFPYGALPP
jgi:hypothetical protein